MVPKWKSKMAASGPQKYANGDVLNFINIFFQIIIYCYTQLIE